jgi:hypothetical protein
MKAISYWALLNPKKTWVILTVIHLALGGLTTYLGILLFLKGIAVPDAVFMAGVIIATIAWILYPVRRSKYKIWKWSYARQKTYDFGLIVGGLLMLLTITNQGAEIALAKVDQNRGLAMQVAMHQQVQVASKLTFWEKIKISHIKKKVQEGFTDLVKQIQVSESWMTWHDWLELGIITIMVLLILGGGLLACSLACNFGNGGLWLVLYAGFIALVIIGANYLLKRVAASKRKMEMGLGFLGL